MKDAGSPRAARTASVLFGIDFTTLLHKWYTIIQKYFSFGDLIVIKSTAKYNGATFPKCVQLS